MCGIAGAVGVRIDPGRLRQCLQGLGHRGPDASGWLAWRSPGSSEVGSGAEITGGAISLLHTRLSILDLTGQAAQPMPTPNGSHHLVFNGELYNFVELRDELARAGWRFRSSGDTEVVLAALTTWGAGALTRFVGMFALALLDDRSGEVLLARDHFGIKPLYYASRPEGFVFASEIPAMLGLGVPARVEPTVVYDYVRRGSVDDSASTFIAGIRALPPASTMVVAADGSVLQGPQAYWSLPPERTDLPFAEAVERCRSLVLESVDLHLRSDVTLGAALSGGVDSSSIVAAMRSSLGSDAPLHTFTYVPDDPRLSEVTWARIVERDVGATDHAVRLDPERFTADLDALVVAQGEPFGTTSVVAQWAVFREARRAGVRVVLGGQGADELFGGYGLFLSARLRMLRQEGRTFDAVRLAAGMLRSQGRHKARSTIVRAGQRAMPSRRHPAGPEAPGGHGLFDPAWLADREVEVADPVHETQLDPLMRRLLRTARLPALLRYEDRNSMTWSVESRVPFLTPALAEFAFSLPLDHIMSGNGQQKVVLRAAMRGLVPDAILDRRDKVGFETPERALLVAGRTVDEFLGQHQSFLCDALTEAPSVLAQRSLDAREYDGLAWRLVNLGRWIDHFGVDAD